MFAISAATDSELETNRIVFQAHLYAVENEISHLSWEITQDVNYESPSLKMRRADLYDLAHTLHTIISDIDQEVYKRRCL